MQQEKAKTMLPHQGAGGNTLFSSVIFVLKKCRFANLFTSFDLKLYIKGYIELLGIEAKKRKKFFFPKHSH